MYVLHCLLFMQILIKLQLQESKPFGRKSKHITLLKINQILSSCKKTKSSRLHSAQAKQVTVCFSSNVVTVMQPRHVFMRFTQNTQDTQTQASLHLSSSLSDRRLSKQTQIKRVRSSCVHVSIKVLSK